jgi:hypothetical protein
VLGAFAHRVDVAGLTVVDDDAAAGHQPMPEAATA